VAVVPSTVHIRDSKEQAGVVLSFPREQWATFAACTRETSV
jgi:hypothetical protein